MRKIAFILALFSCLFLFSNLAVEDSSDNISEVMPVAEVLGKLGAPKAPHILKPNVRGVTVDRGRDIVLKGSTDSPFGGKSDRVSKHFVCTSCHNVERDEPDLSVSDPMGRLKYVSEKGLPFLQGSALYGIVDRRNFYNGDYKKKYGGLVEAARNDLRQAIHLCATECSQGRPLEAWEMESVLAYLWTIGLKMEDLNFSENEWKRVGNAIGGKGDKETAIELVQSKYLLGFPATFIDPPSDRKVGFSKEGNPETGKMIYDLSCLHCHDEKRYSFFDLDSSKLAFEFLDKHISTYSRYSIYQVARYGTSPVLWKKAYMPHYTKEKMNEQMLEDLRVYIEQKAK